MVSQDWTFSVIPLFSGLVVLNHRTLSSFYRMCSWWLLLAGSSLGRDKWNSAYTSAFKPKCILLMPVIVIMIKSDLSSPFFLVLEIDSSVWWIRGKLSVAVLWPSLLWPNPKPYLWYSSASRSKEALFTQTRHSCSNSVASAFRKFIDAAAVVFVCSLAEALGCCIWEESVRSEHLEPAK